MTHGELPDGFKAQDVERLRLEAKFAPIMREDLRLGTLVWYQLSQHPIDRTSILQDQLDLANKERTSLFPWRGQFSPELIELLLEAYAGSEAVVLDPFVGSGTTLFESARRGLASYGAEINPAAYQMASTALFVTLSPRERDDYIREAETLLRKYFRPQRDLFTWAEYQGDEEATRIPSTQALRQLAAEASASPLLDNIIANTVMQYIEYEGNGSCRSIYDSFYRHARVVRELPHGDRPARAILSDAREIPLEAHSVSLVLTSPPYINVFNYHQNYRRAMELLGWDLLEVAKSEIGSNRKHRSNRFLTVIQYALDMRQVLCELHRLLRPQGRIIIVIGRESRVRGIPFNNCLLLAALATAGAGFQLVQRQERKFTNKFGQTIFEDLIHLVPTSPPPSNGDEIARGIAVHLLEEAERLARRADVRADLAAACEQLLAIQPSPLFEVRRRIQP